ncbi:MAG: hypothetical protein WAU01_02190 [Saprospiraceae bacterium]
MCNACTLNPGVIVNQDFDACHKSNQLKFDVTKSFPVSAFDSITYDYTNVVFSDTMLLAYQTNPDLTSYSAGRYTICPVQTAKGQQGVLPTVGIKSNPELLKKYFFENASCADVSDKCMIVNIIPEKPIVNIVKYICQDEGYTFHDTTYYQAGIYHVVVQKGICDSTVILDLRKNTIPFSLITDKDSISCLNPSIGINAVPSGAISGMVSYDWFTQDGAIVGNVNGSTIEANAAGKYFVSISLTANGITCTDTLHKQLFKDNSFPTIKLQGDTITCLQDTVIISAFVSPPVNVKEWRSKNGFNFIASNESAKVWASDTYYFKVKSDNGCEVIDSIFIFENKTVSIPSFRSDTITCIKVVAQINTTVSDSTQYNYFWSGVLPGFINAQNPFVNQAGIFNLRLTHQKNGCVKNFVAKVEEDKTPPSILLLSSDTLTCLKTTVVPNFLFGQPIQTYRWSGPGLSSSQMSPAVTQAGNFVVSVTSAINGCPASASFTIYKDDDIPQLQFSADSISCHIDSVRILVTSNEPLKATHWTGPNNFQSVDISPFVYSKGIYHLSFEGINGCMGTALYEVESSRDVPDPRYGVDSISCLNDTATFRLLTSSQNYDYIWAGPNSFTDSIAEPMVFEPGIYTVTVTDPVSDCKAIKSFNVVDDRVYTIPDLTVDTLGCVKKSVQLFFNNTDIKSMSVVGPSFVSEDISPFVTEPGRYTYTIVNDKNCVTTGTVDVIKNDSVPILQSIFKPFGCGQDSILIQGFSSISNTNLSWKGPFGFSEAGSSVFVKTGGNYSLKGVTALGCETILNFSVGHDTIKPEVKIMPHDTLTCFRTSVQLKVSDTTFNGIFKWLPNNLVSNSVLVTTPGKFVVQATGANNCSAYDTTVVIENKKIPTYTYQSSLINCKNLLSAVKLIPDSDVTSIIWDNATNPTNISEQTREFNTSFFGDYSFKLTNDLGCIASGRLEVKRDVLPPEIIKTITDTINCNQSTANVGVVLTNKAIEYLWNGPKVIDLIADSVISVAEPGDYFLKITGSNYCVTNVNFKVAISYGTPEFITFSDTLTCEKGKVNIGVIALTPLAGYSWEGPNQYASSVKNPKVFDVGTYTVTVTGVNGCTAVQNVQVTQDITRPSISIPDTLFLPCDKSPIQLSVASTSSIKAYKWVFPDSSITEIDRPVSAMVGKYYVQITGINGCFSIEKPFILLVDNVPPKFSFSTDTLTCLKSIALLKASGAASNMYQWVSPTGRVSIGDQIQTSESGIYKLKVIDDRKCLDSTDVQVWRDTITPKIMVSVSGEIQCKVKNVSLNANTATPNTGLSGIWTTVDGNIVTKVSDFNIIADKAGSYLFKLTNRLTGCSSQQIISVSESVQKFTSFAAAVSPPSCFGSENGAIQILNLNGKEPYKIKLNNVIKNNQLLFTNLSPGDYSFEVTDSFGCIVNKVVNVPQGVDLNIELQKEVTILFGDSLLLMPKYNTDPTGTAKIIWYESDSVVCQGCTELWVRPLANKLYKIEYAVDQFCRKSASILVRVKNDIDKAIPNIFSPSSTNGNDRFFIPQIRGIERINYIKIFGRWAENVFEAYDILPGDAALGWDGTFHGQPVQPGVFLLWAELVLADGKVYKYQGDLTVIR